MTVKNFEDRVLKGALNMVAPDVEIEGRGLILISSEEGETSCNNDKTLKSFDLIDGAILSVDDFMQEYNLKIFLYHSDKLEDGVDYELIGDISSLKEKFESINTSKDPKENTTDEKEEKEDDDIVMVVEHGNGDRKRPNENDELKGEPVKKKHKTMVQDNVQEKDDNIICLE